VRALAFTIVFLVTAVWARDAGASACCAPSPLGTYAGKSCDQGSLGTAGCVEDPAGTGTCVGGDLTPPVVYKVKSARNANDVVNIVDACVPTEEVPGETPEQRVQRQTAALELCLYPNACVCVGDGPQVACFVREGNVSQFTCTRRSVFGCCTAGACH
jgi:hypothetical protein